MTNYRLEPVEAMNLAYELGGCEDGSYHLEADELEQVIQTATQSVQGEPVGYQCHSCRKTTPPPAPFKAYVECDECGALTASPIAARLTAQQPAEQRCEYCDGTGDVHSLDGEWRGTCDCPAGQQPEPISRNLRAVHAMILNALDRDAAEGKAVRGEMAAEQQAAPDVAGLKEALKSMVSGYMRLLQSGYDRITDLGGDCDPVDVMERDDAYLREARATLAAHRKQGGE